MWRDPRKRELNSNFVCKLASPVVFVCVRSTRQNVDTSKCNSIILKPLFKPNMNPLVVSDHMMNDAFVPSNQNMIIESMNF